MLNTAMVSWWLLLSIWKQTSYDHLYLNINSHVWYHLLQAICETYWEKNYCGGMDTMSRRCRAASACQPGSFCDCGACHFDYTIKKTICSKCNFGIEDVSYECGSDGTCWCIRRCVILKTELVYMCWVIPSFNMWRPFCFKNSGVT